MTCPSRTVAAAAAVAAGLALAQDAGAQARACPEPRPIAGGTFEASGVVHVPGSSGVLVVDDGRARDVLWIELDAAGGQRGRAVRIPTGADVNDPEGLTTDGTYIYVVGSQSKKKGLETDGLVRFRFDAQGRRVSDVQRIGGLKAWLAANVPELRGTATRVGDQVLNIEGLAWDPSSNRLLLGFRAPLVDGQALVVPIRLRDPTGAFAASNLEVDGGVIRLPLGGLAIRGFEYDEAARAFRVIAGGGPDSSREDYRLFEWDGSPRPASLREIARFPRALKAEGITGATLEGRRVAVVVFDASRILVTDAACWADPPRS